MNKRFTKKWKIRNTKKYCLLVFMLIGLLFATGFGTKQVKLYGDKQLIDLNKAIKVTPPGKQIKSGETKETVEIEAEKTDVEKKEKTNENVSKYDIEISISGKDIFFDGEKCKDMNELKMRLDRCPEEARIRLEDNYAETNCFQEVLEIVDELIEEKGVTCDKIEKTE